MTYDEIKTKVAEYLNRTDLTDEIADDFIKLCEADFNAKLRIRQMEQFDDVEYVVLRVFKSFP